VPFTPQQQSSGAHGVGTKTVFNFGGGGSAERMVMGGAGSAGRQVYSGGYGSGGKAMESTDNTVNESALLQRFE